MPAIRSRVTLLMRVLVLGAGIVGGAGIASAGEGDASTGEPDTTASPEPTAVEVLRSQAEAVAPLFRSDVARRFLEATADLPSIAEPRIVYVNRATRDVLGEAEAGARTSEELSGYERRELDEAFYYFTKYGTPLASVRAFDLAANAGLASLDGSRIIDFGFGSIGQLRIVASLGADVAGVEVDPLLRVLYSHPEDTGWIPRAASAGDGERGRIVTHYGQFPADPSIANAVGTGYDLFVSKNTLKRGYIHPEREVDPRMLVHLGVDDVTFVRAMYDVLDPGGIVVIYNLHPVPAAESEPYVPWADGRCPFERALLESTGFEVLAFDADDTPAARAMGQAFGWAEDMDFRRDLLGTYTLLRRPPSPSDGDRP